MKVDVAFDTTTAVTSTADILYIKLNHTAAEIAEMFVEEKHNGDAVWGGATGSFREIRQRFVIRYGGSWSDPTYLWSGVRFLLTATPIEWVARLTQDQQLRPEDWFRAGSGTVTFGSGAGQSNLLTSLAYNYQCRLHTLCSEVDVEDLLLSHLQGRIRFGDTEVPNQVGASLISYDSLWKRIYDQSARFQSELSASYVTPLALGDEAVRFRLAGIVAKAVAVDLMRSHEPTAKVLGPARYKDWDDEVKSFLKSPPQLAGCEQVGVGGGSITVERA